MVLDRRIPSPGAERAPRRACRLGLPAALALALVQPAHAGDVGGAVGVVSDKLYRGISSTDGRPALEAALDYRGDTGWGAALDLAASLGGPRADAATVTLQRGWQLDADWTAQLGLAREAYFGTAARRRYDRTEASASLAWQGRWVLTLAASPDTRRFAGGRLRRGAALAADLAFHERLAGRLAFDAGIGYQDLHAVGSASYVYGSAGLRWGFGPLQLWVARVAAPQASSSATSGGRGGVNGWAASAFWSF